jgi:hypothetical protein
VRVSRQLVRLLASAVLLVGTAAVAEDGSVDLDAAEGAAGPLPAPAALPEVEDPEERARLERARARLEAARQRLEAANVAYSQMRARDYPRGAARAEIVAERASAREEYEDADRSYSELIDAE